MMTNFEELVSHCRFLSSLGPVSRVGKLPSGHLEKGRVAFPSSRAEIGKLAENARLAQRCLFKIAD